MNLSIKNKINNKPLNHFQSLGINIRTLYRYVDQYNSNKARSAAVLEHLYGPGNIKDRLYLHYLGRLFEIKKYEDDKRRFHLREIRSELFSLVELFNLPNPMIEQIWDDITVVYLQ